MMVASSFTLIRRSHGASNPQREGVDLRFFQSNCARLILIERANIKLQRRTLVVTILTLVVGIIASWLIVEG
jgi:hypothetical protein